MRGSRLRSERRMYFHVCEHTSDNGPHVAQENVELAVLSAVEHGRDANPVFAARIGFSITPRERVHPDRPNELWRVDYKGEFMLADRR
jgi:hypothetical protein